MHTPKIPANQFSPPAFRHRRRFCEAFAFASGAGDSAQTHGSQDPERSSLSNPFVQAGQGNDVIRTARTHAQRMALRGLCVGSVECCLGTARHQLEWEAISHFETDDVGTYSVADCSIYLPADPGAPVWPFTWLVAPSNTNLNHLQATRDTAAAQASSAKEKKNRATSHTLQLFLITQAPLSRPRVYQAAGRPLPRYLCIEPRTSSTSETSR